ncbi:MAG: hypothetical protein EOO09_06810 [Chitinophagaceae bacterium]|nr:MAG: hypothetical protein EOO09_06810 [Chitinophagaceae bacterium]
MAIQIRNETISLFDGRDKFSILQISDVHIWFSNAIPDALEKIIENTKPDLIALTGDYYDTPRGATIFSRFMQKTGSRYPVVFIGGNHDIWWGNRVFRRVTEVSNCTYVDRDFFSMQTQGGRRINVGTVTHRELFDRHRDDINILLVHNPEELRPADTGHVDLILAGHLHGGQIVFYKKDKTYYPGALLFRHCSDRKQINDSTLIVSRGAGDTFPIRINCPKEVVLVTME